MGWKSTSVADRKFKGKYDNYIDTPKKPKLKTHQMQDVIILR